MTKNRTRTPVYLDPGMHPGLEVKGLICANGLCASVQHYGNNHVIYEYMIKSSGSAPQQARHASNAGAMLGRRPRHRNPKDLTLQPGPCSLIAVPPPLNTEAARPIARYGSRPYRAISTDKGRLGIKRNQ